MFCPNCGNNCGDDRFCPSCGTQLQQTAAPAAQSGEWKVGMPCPHCGATKLEGDCCAFCGAQLLVDKVETADNTDDSYEIPYGPYLGFGQTLHIAKEELVVEERKAFSKKRTHIPYNHITEIIYKLSEWGSPSIWFTYRSNGGVKKILFSCGSDDYSSRFYHLLFVLKMLVPSEALFTILLPQKETDILNRYVGRIDLDSYFIRYNPYRKQAALALRKEYAIKEKESYLLTDALFNIKQQELYEKFPEYAVRDLNRYEKERLRLIRKKIEEIEKRQMTMRRY